MILKTMVVSPFATNCYIVGSEESSQGMLIDPGDEAPEILNTISSLGLSIQLIVLTHSHIDHVGALKECREATGAAVAIHAKDAESLTKNTTSRLLGLNYPAPPPPDQLLEDTDKLR